MNSITLEQLKEMHIEDVALLFDGTPYKPYYGKRGLKFGRRYTFSPEDFYAVGSGEAINYINNINISK